MTKYAFYKTKNELDFYQFPVSPNYSETNQDYHRCIPSIYEQSRSHSSIFWE